MNGDVNTGFVSTGSDELGTYAGGVLVTKEYSSGFAWFNTSNSANYIAAAWSTNALTQTGTNINAWTFTSAMSGGTQYSIGNTSSGALTWTFSNLGSSNGDYVGGINLVSDRSGANPVIQVRKKDQIILGANSGILNSVSVVSAGRADVSNVGGTTSASATTTISGSSTNFIQDFGVGDRVSLSSASTTYATVTAIASSTSMTVSAALGNGTSQTLNRKSAIHRWDNGSAVPVAYFTDAGALYTGAPISGPTFFQNAATKLQVNGTMSTVSSSLADIIQIGSVSCFQLSPSADTNSGFGAAIYTPQGFNMNIVSSFNVNGGLPVLGVPWVTSALGAFGQTNVNNCTGKTIDGIGGVGCIAGFNGYGGTLTNAVGGAFTFTSSDDSGTGTVTGSITGTVVGGNFTAFIDQDGVSTPTAAGGRFIEPYVVGGSGTITNKTAAWIDGTFSVTETDSSSTGNIDAYAPTTSYNYMTGAAPVLRGINNDTFNKVLIFDFANTATISNENATPTAAKRITTGTGADIANVKACELVYNTTTSRWRVVSYRL